MATRKAVRSGSRAHIARIMYLQFSINLCRTFHKSVLPAAGAGDYALGSRLLALGLILRVCAYIRYALTMKDAHDIVIAQPFNVINNNPNMIFLSFP